MLSFGYSSSKVSKKRQSFNYRDLSKEVEVGIVFFVAYRDCVSGLWVLSYSNFNQSGLKYRISGNFC